MRGLGPVGWFLTPFSRGGVKGDEPTPDASEMSEEAWGSSSLNRRYARGGDGWRACSALCAGRVARPARYPPTPPRFAKEMNVREGSMWVKCCHGMVGVGGGEECVGRAREGSGGWVDAPTGGPLLGPGSAPVHTTQHSPSPLMRVNRCSWSTRLLPSWGCGMWGGATPPMGRSQRVAPRAHMPPPIMKGDERRVKWGENWTSGEASPVVNLSHPLGRSDVGEARLALSFRHFATGVPSPLRPITQKNINMA